MSEQGLLEFAEDLRRYVEEAVEQGEPYSEPEFTKLVIDQLATEGILQNPIYLDQEGTFGQVKYKITGYGLDETDGRLLLITTVYKDLFPPEPVPLDELRTAGERAMRFFSNSAAGLHGEIEPSRTDASELARRLYELRRKITFVNVVVLTDGLVGSRTLADDDLNDAKVAFDLIGIERLRRVLGEGFSREHIQIDLTQFAGGGVPCLPVPVADGSYEAYLAALPGRVLYDAYARYGTQLLELNVRAFLGVRGRKSVNAGLRTTLKDEPVNFLAYNNGIVATVDRLEMAEDVAGARLLRLHGFQIVNGGQTTASIHRTEGVNLDLVRVPAKIIVVPPDTLSRMVTAISHSANRQNTVQPADFSANDPFHVRVEQLANNTWLTDGTGRWFYERARGSYTAQEARAESRATQRRAFARETPVERRFSKTDLATYLNAWEGRPDLVSYGTQKNFQYFMQSLRDSRLDPARLDESWFRKLIGIAIIYRATAKIVKQEKFPQIKANILAYTVAMLSWVTGGRIDFDRVWQRQKISPELEGMLRRWSHHVDEALRAHAGDRQASEAAKRAQAWESLKEHAPALTDPLPPELSAQGQLAQTGQSGASRNENLNAGDLGLINEARGISAENWLQVAAWGQSSRAISPTLSGVARSLAELALGKWDRGPSVKQARAGLAALQAFHERERDDEPEVTI